MHETMLILLAGALTAGFLGSLTGLGGGVIVVPLMTLGLGIDIHYAIGTSLVSVIATSSGAAMTNIRKGLLNLRLAMFLEIATTSGAIAGAALAHFMPTRLIAVIFGLVLLYSSLSSFRNQAGAAVDHKSMAEDRTGNGRVKAGLISNLGGTYHGSSGIKQYHLRRPAGGFSVMALAGILSGLLGIGSGALKVIAMDSIMKVPFKVSAATSNFMIGVTAAASAGVYLSRGYIDPLLSMPVMLGVLAGSLAGARILSQSRTRRIRKVFALVILLLAIEMMYHGFINSI